MRKIWPLVIGFIAALSPVAACAEWKGPALQTDLCTLAARPRHFNHKLVSISAHFTSDGYSSLDVLFDPRCAGKRIDVWVRGSVSGAAILNKALETGEPGTWGKSIEGTWIGLFQWAPKSYSTGTLDVVETANLKVAFDEPIDLTDNAQSPIETTLDDIWAHPARYSHRLVTFDGYYLGTIHGSAIYRCDSRGMVDLWSWMGARGEQDIESAVNQNFAGSMGKIVSATWTGRISWSDSPYDPRRVIKLNVTEVRNIVAASRERSHCRGGLAASFAPKLSELGF
jgi:hypothetical protein